MLYSYNNVWDELCYFSSAQYSKNYLQAKYERSKSTDQKTKAFHNAYPFLYYLEHGKSYFDAAKHSQINVKPTLLFYGLVQLLKACILTVDPYYPSSTAILAHGVTSRKIKKIGYSFTDDEVKIQKNGLFTHASKVLFNINNLEGEKFTMLQLLQSIPELSKILKITKNGSTFIPITIENDLITIPEQILSSYHFTSERFISFLHSKQATLDIVIVEQNQKQIKIKSNFPDKLLNKPPFYFNLFSQNYLLKSQKESLFLLPEILYHYLLLYNLSMICRYETDWWCELLQSYSTDDYPLINQFLTTTEQKIPYLIHRFLTT
ncbi:YaaC family protein [Gottfriedia luciferensis]|uniref:YaaC family protein n=1 Tax=Gottfriedia luciferensis TaxID=178774 RepID=UPI000B43BB94|nr:YaaC family protein [Gottfriedia luciferensis]